ncbi:M20/M25/M40 family metallo-hydrolase [Aureimonas altamirensis]|uniref:M20/M25/M40 family metallo-hydrolase n=1 Tax=Aureimonas altamirensis TaxID=370622 RepID=UPI001E62263D|nr:M20/M25/M40 family metallo-hydrolase [Aureimonas altamirensis]UHD44554.1 M20/M25/M40 family metallo-hydrolase [Aureimonas altamirensis]
MTPTSLRSRLATASAADDDDLVQATAALVAIDSQTPPSDTRAVVQHILQTVAHVEGLEIERRPGAGPVDNVVLSLRGHRPGKRVILSCHLDTYPVGDIAGWTVPPLSGAVRDGKLYGRGSCDMKGGVAASLRVLDVMAAHRTEWSGELVLALAGDEESMGEQGTQVLIDSSPVCSDALVIVPDVGSPGIVRCGEKGMIWLRLTARGSAAHGAHVHRGINAIDRLADALAAFRNLTAMRTPASHEAVATMQAAFPLSEGLGGEGEMDVMSRVTVNVGRIEGGISPNLVPDEAVADVDIRIPLGILTTDVEREIHAILGGHPGVSCSITRRYEATWTSPDHPLVRNGIRAAEGVLGRPVVANMRVGASDARLWRRAGMATIVLGLTPHNLGGPDEHLDIAELPVLASILALTVYDCLAGEPAC